MKLVILSSMVFLLSFGCQQTEVPGVEDVITNKEIATDIKLYYSDSAVTQFKIISPRRESYEEDKKLIEEYPDGLEIEFYDKDKNITSSMLADYAKRISVDGLMIMKDRVVLVNAQGDKLTTTGITWDEVNGTLKTSKFVQLINMSARDTTYGFGFEALDDFSKFTINQLTGKRRYQNLSQELDVEE